MSAPLIRGEFLKVAHPFNRKLSPVLLIRNRQIPVVLFCTSVMLGTLCADDPINDAIKFVN